MSDATNVSAGPEILSEADVERTITRMTHEIIEKNALDSANSNTVILLGIPSGGVPIAQRLAANIKNFTGIEVGLGAIDTTLYRDDLRGKPHRALRPTSIPDSGIDGATVVLVDDVLYSGRTIRAALDGLRDLGRPALVQLAVLVDRGHRELPIRADYVGKNLPTSKSENVTVSLRELDGADAVTLRRKGE